jgi:hypothetical protein
MSLYFLEFLILIEERRKGRTGRRQKKEKQRRKGKNFSAHYYKFIMQSYYVHVT